MARFASYTNSRSVSKTDLENDHAASRIITLIHNLLLSGHETTCIVDLDSNPFATSRSLSDLSLLDLRLGQKQTRALPWFQEEEASWPSCPPQRAEHSQRSRGWCLYVLYCFVTLKGLTTCQFDNKMCFHMFGANNVGFQRRVPRLGQEFLVVASLRLKRGAIPQNPGLPATNEWYSFSWRTI